MIRELTIAAAAAAVGYALGQRATESAESRFDRPEVTGDDVAIDRSTTGQDRFGPQSEWPDRSDEEVIGR
jgi:hypothetical protein